MLQCALFFRHKSGCGNNPSCDNHIAADIQRLKNDRKSFLTEIQPFYNAGTVRTKNRNGNKNKFDKRKQNRSNLQNLSVRNFFYIKKEPVLQDRR